ncbi:MAG TPA: DUF3667 domain-containing protein [Casimicrobiaceae bacterium]|nr:DUF3667 domain-containing protein [Casimicrobiaceae bacterium]
MAELAPLSGAAAPADATHACRNCGAGAAPGAAYCSHCGQETSLALPTVRAMLRDAAGRYVALDGRMWRTLFPLLLRPGFLSREYFAGRRRRYIRPARLFLVLSIALFALLRLGGEPVTVMKGELFDSDRSDVGHEIADAGKQEGFDIGPDLNFDLGTDLGSWFDPVRRRIQQFNKLSRAERGEQIFAGMLRYGPYAAFVLLPLFALLLKLLYVGRARRYPLRPRRYAAHLVFGAHSHAFVFLASILLVVVPVRAVRVALVLWMCAYLLWSMKAVYGGRWSGVLARGFVVAVVYLVFFAFVVAGLVVAAVLLG